MPPSADPQPYGPNTAAVRAFLRDLAQQPPAAWVRAARVYRTLAGSEAFVRADTALGAAIENAGLERARDAVVGPLVQLAGGVAARAADRTVDADDLAEAALAAALALVARHLVAPEAFATLAAPFAALVAPAAS